MPIVTALTRRINVYTMMVIGTLVSAVPTYLLCFGPSLSLLLAYLILFSIGEALWMAGSSAVLVDDMILFCPAGMVERRCSELLWSFTLECLRIFFHTLFRTPRGLGSFLILMIEIAAGILGDLFATGSLRRLKEDICWVCVKAPGPGYGFNVRVVICMLRTIPSSAGEMSSPLVLIRRTSRISWRIIAGIISPVRVN